MDPGALGRGDERRLLTRPAAWRSTESVVSQASRRPTMLTIIRAMSGGRIEAISRSRPTMIVSVWWRAWLQRQKVGSLMFMNDATW
jgi:hypothetical protein